VVPDPRDRVHIRARVDKRIGNLDVAVKRRPVQRCHAIGVRRPYVGTLIDQGAYGGLVTTLGGIGD